MNVSRYTTPELGIIFPNSVTPSDITEFWVTITQGQTIKIDRTKTSFTQDAQNPQRFSTVLTELETASLVDDLDCELQVRAAIDGQAVASSITVLSVSDVLKEGEIL